MTVTYYTRVSKMDTWTERSCDISELGGEIEYFIGQGYSIKCGNAI